MTLSTQIHITLIQKETVPGTMYTDLDILEVNMEDIPAGREAEALQLLADRIAKGHLPEDVSSQSHEWEDLHGGGSVRSFKNQHLVKYEELVGAHAASH